MRDDAPSWSKFSPLAVLVILVGMLAIFAVHAAPALLDVQPLDRPAGTEPQAVEQKAPAQLPADPALGQEAVPVQVFDSASRLADADDADARPVEAEDKPREAASAPAAEPDAAAQDDETLTRTEDGTKEVISGTVTPGDTAAKLLGGDVHGIMQASRRYHSLANIRSGQAYTVVRDRETKALQRFEYEIDAHRKLVVELDVDTFTSRVEPIVYDVQLALLQGTVESSLFQSVAAMGESPSLAIVVADVFRWDVDFIRDVQDGDSFSILVEKRYRDGQFKNYGRVLGATFANKGTLFEAFLFRGVSGNASHYNKRGESLRKVLLKAPLAFTRITSGYSKGRKHPIFHDVRPHEGVDYGAPTGTPIKAVGDGVVSQKGWQGGYGNAITIRHGAGLESQYAHMSGYARGMAVGTRVRQGQVIGFVGMTGWATGPHLDFRLKQHGRFINPTKAINPREESISPGRMQEFEARKTQIRNFVAGETPLYLYNPDAFK